MSSNRANGIKENNANSNTLEEKALTVNLEIICIGNELLIGKIKDTNAHYLAKQATQLGANVTRVTVIQDTIEEISGAINEAIARKPQFIVTTGGLGPTFDDKTLQGLAKALNLKLEVNPKALAFVTQRMCGIRQKTGVAHGNRVNAAKG